MRDPYREYCPPLICALVVVTFVMHRGGSVVGAYLACVMLILVIVAWAAEELSK